MVRSLLLTIKTRKKTIKGNTWSMLYGAVGQAFSIQVTAIAPDGPIRMRGATAGWWEDGGSGVYHEMPRGKTIPFGIIAVFVENPGEKAGVGKYEVQFTVRTGTDM